MRSKIYFPVYCSTLAYIHSVGSVELKAMQIVFHLDPKTFVLVLFGAAIENFVLWLHVGEIEGLVVGVGAIQTVV